MKKKTVYFAHSQRLYFTLIEKLIENILNDKGYDIINPRDFNMDEHDKKVVDFDFNKLKSCDEVLCLFIQGQCNSNIGTVFEMHWAIELNKKLTVVSNFQHPFLDKFANVYYMGIENFKNDVIFHKRK